MKRQKKSVIALNISNAIVLIALVFGILFAVLSVSVIFGIFGQEVFNAVLKQLFIYSLVLEVPNTFIIIFTIISLCACLCRKSPKKVEPFMVLHIVCAVLSGLCIAAPLCIGVFTMIRNSMQGNFSGSDWEAIWMIVIYACLEGFSLMTSIFTVKYLSNILKEQGE